MREDELHVLLVEDTESDAVLIQRIFDSFGPQWKVFVSPLLRLACVYLKDCQPDVVLLDLHLPNGDGVEVIRKVRHFAPHAPLVVLRGSDDEEVKREAMAMGVTGYLSKGEVMKTLEGPQKLLDSMRDAVAGRRAARLPSQAPDSIDIRLDLMDEMIERTRKIKANVPA